MPDIDFDELERLFAAAKPLIECDHRANRPNPRIDGERIVGFVIDQDLIGLGLSEPLFALDALVKAASEVPRLLEAAREGERLRSALERLSSKGRINPNIPIHFGPEDELEQRQKFARAALEEGTKG